MLEENRHRIIIGVFGENDPYPEIPKIVRKTTYGKELDFYKLPTDYACGLCILTKLRVQLHIRGQSGD